ncbi:class I SAM-dependent methyltransferase [Deinococcus rubellus]|uniref:Class I SAM-dependent methyltransferase n=2 Tax=Deinococcus rubellus TaxID=1889240 RepID=A0ABY5YH52_9DEIO|nr:class I SAM-dependent methyltransferase [Deinococcus rubellus]UWX63727.1 class I SAM-dependent methyltransferase [Deinococcus rubellus]
MRLSTLEQLLDTLDHLFDDGSDWTRRNAHDHWADLFGRPDHPLNSDLPDANLVDWQKRGLLPTTDLPRTGSKMALDIGCGLGRNTRWLAAQGYCATGVDLSRYAVSHARERSPDSSASYAECDVLREEIPGGPFDVVYDSGCFHHLAPHRRLSYLTALSACLKPGGLFGICTFAPGEMGSVADDLTLFRQGRLEGGTAYSTDDLQAVFSELELLDSGPLSPDNAEAVFAMGFLNAALFRRPE